MNAPMAEAGANTAAANKHDYLRTHRISGQSLRCRFPGDELALDERARSSKTGRAGKTLVKEGALRITQIALRTGSALGSHQVSGALSVQVLRGRLRMTTTDGELWLERGELVALDAGVAHAAEAMSDCALLITMAMPHVEARS